MAKKYALNLILSVLVLALTGCGVNIAIIDNTVIPDTDLSTSRQLKLMDNDGPIYIQEIVTNDGIETYEYSPNRTPFFDLPDIATADFHTAQYNQNHYMVVEGSIGPNTKYPIILDTGANLDALIVQDIHIKQNDLQVYPLKNSTGHESKMSLCAIEKLQFGNFKLTDYTGICWGQHIELKLLGIIPLARSTDICFPLPLMSKFKYFTFDTPARKVHFSVKKSFCPENKENWHQFPIEIERLSRDPSKQFLFVDMEINGQKIRPLLDTGAGLGLMMNNDLWDRVKKNFDRTSRKNMKFILPYHFEGNKPSCTAVKVRNLAMGDINVKNAEITVLPKTKSWKKTECLLGMAYFRDRQVTIDFEKNTLWIKKI